MLPRKIAQLERNLSDLISKSSTWQRNATTAAVQGTTQKFPGLSPITVRQPDPPVDGVFKRATTSGKSILRRLTVSSVGTPSPAPAPATVDGSLQLLIFSLAVFPQQLHFFPVSICR